MTACLISSLQNSRPFVHVFSLHRQSCEALVSVYTDSDAKRLLIHFVNITYKYCSSSVVVKNIKLF